MTQNIWKGGILAWEDADALCISVVFTWHLSTARKYAEAMRHRRVRIGGPAVSGAMTETRREIMRRSQERT